MFVNASIRQYVDQAASNAETPGGGSVSGLVGALAACMGEMAANFTTGKKKFADVESRVLDILATLTPLRETMLKAMDDDAVAFAKFADVYAMPKDTEEDKSAREAAMQKALRGAMAVPLSVMLAAVKALEVLPELAKIGNPNLISDTGVAAILAEAATRAAYLNVMVNLKFIKDTDLVRDTRAEVEDLLARAARSLKLTMGPVEKSVLGL